MKWHLSRVLFSFQMRLMIPGHSKEPIQRQCVIMTMGAKRKNDKFRNAGAESSPTLRQQFPSPWVELARCQWCYSAVLVLDPCVNPPHRYPHTAPASQTRADPVLTVAASHCSKDCMTSVHLPMINAFCISPNLRARLDLAWVHWVLAIPPPMVITCL